MMLFLFWQSIQSYLFVFLFVKMSKSVHSGLKSNNRSLYLLPIFLTLNEINFGNNKPTAREVPVTIASDFL
jgi:hypothetical protein